MENFFQENWEKLAVAALVVATLVYITHKDADVAPAKRGRPSMEKK